MEVALDLLKAYAITFGWAMVGCLSMGLGIVMTLKMVHWCTHEVDYGVPHIGSRYCCGFCYPH